MNETFFRIAFYAICFVFGLSFGMSKDMSQKILAGGTLVFAALWYAKEVLG